MKKSETGQILDYVRHIDERFEKIDQRFDAVDTRLDAVDARLNKLDRNLSATRIELVDHMERIHTELTGRIVDLENPPKSNRGGNGGVPLAS
jgi:DNA anti-recombination protein RmuC